MGLARAGQVLYAATKHVVVPALLRRKTPSAPERVQAALEELGGAWVKLGQALALRFDVLPPAYCLQLFQLLNQVRPFPAQDVRRTIEADLGKPVETLFRSFEWRPIAAASVGQVHRAELPDGTAVAVKVQRPDIRALIRADLTLMRWIAGFADRTSLFGRTRLRELVEEFARWTEEELDYLVEARHAAMLRRNAEGDRLEVNPRVHASHTSARVLTLDYLEGPSVLDVITALRRGDEAFLAPFRAEGHDPRRLASHLVWNALNQIYRHGYFHADPHPANLIVLPGDTVGYVDFGIVGKLDDRARESLRYFAQSLFSGATGNAVDEFMRFLTPSSETDVAAARRDLSEAMHRYVESARVGPGGASLSEDAFEIEILEVAKDHAMKLSPDAVRYLKAVLTAEAMVKELDPTFDLRAHENRFFSRLMEIEATESFDPRRLGQRLLDARFRFSRLLDSLENLREAPGRVLGVARDVRRRVQLLSILAMLGGIAVLVSMWTARTRPAFEVFGYPPEAVALGGAAVSFILLLVTILQVRRLPSEAGFGSVPRYPRRTR